MNQLGQISWLASYPKSANTGLRMFLCAYRTGGEVDINYPIDTGTQDTNTVFYTSVCPVDFKELNPYQKLLIRPAALMYLCALIPDPPLFVKTHFANGRLCGVDVIPQQLTSRAVYLVRDPRDVAVSLAEHTGESIDTIISDMAEKDFVLEAESMYQHVSSWSYHVRSWQKSKFPVLMLRFEDLIADPQFIFAQVVEFLQLGLDEKKLEQAVKSASFASLQKQEREKGFRERARADHIFFKRGKAGGWRNILTEKQARQIEEDHGEVMQEFGYLAEDLQTGAAVTSTFPQIETSQKGQVNGSISL